MAVTHYLQAVEAVKTTETKAVAARMHSQPVSTPMLSNASVRANGRVVYDLNILRVKSPAQSKSPADVAEVIGKLAGDRVFKPLAGTACKFV
jgi:branched-chain amino acid transport system substrate-binding protein